MKKTLTLGFVSLLLFLNISCEKTGVNIDTFIDIYIVNAQGSPNFFIEQIWKVRRVLQYIKMLMKRSSLEYLLIIYPMKRKQSVRLNSERHQWMKLNVSLKQRGQTSL